VDLPDLLLSDAEDDVKNIVDNARLALLRNMAELEQAYSKLVQRVGEVIATAFDGQGVAAQARSALLSWIVQVEDQTGSRISSRLFDDAVVDSLIAVSQTDIPPNEDFAEYVGRRMIGLSLYDWGDHTEVEFGNRLAVARDRIVSELAQPHTSTAEMYDVAIRLPSGDSLSFEFMEAELSEHARNLLTNLKMTIEITGRALSADERRRIGVELLRYVLERRG
jgi:hypothetical protein